MLNLTATENAQPGTLDWQLTRFHLDDPPNLRAYPLHRNLRSSAIEGYASRTSVAPGESIDLMVSMNPGGHFRADIYRTGYYAGSGGRHLLTIGPLPAEPQPVPPMTTARLRECGWPPATTLRIPADWRSGVYVAKLTRDEPFGAQSYIIFVVKEHRQTELLFQVSDITWQAYNKWPGSDSLYDDGLPEIYTTSQGVRVSFDRPYARYFQGVDTPLSLGSGEFFIWEQPLSFWLEGEGYDVTYCSNVDMHLDPGLLDYCKVFLSVGHDEYWTQQMYANVRAARDRGVSLVFLSGNAVCTQINPYPGMPSGTPFRNFDRGHVFPDERELMGSSTFGPAYGDWTVANADHWVFEGTGFKNGDSIPGLIGFEYHGVPVADVPGLEIVAHSPILRPPPRPTEVVTEWHTRGDNMHAAVVYPGPRGNWVFNAGTIWWADGLSHPPGHTPAMARVIRTRDGNTFTYGGRPQGPDQRVQRITHNVLRRCLESRTTWAPGEAQ